MIDVYPGRALRPEARVLSPSAGPEDDTAQRTSPRVLVEVLMPSAADATGLTKSLPGFELRRLWAAKGSAAPTPRQVLAAVNHPPGVMLLLDAELAARWGAAAVRMLQQRLSGALLLVWSGPQDRWVDLVLRARIRGAVHAETASEQLHRALSTVQCGGMWFPRDFMQRLVEVARSRWRAHDPADDVDADGGLQHAGGEGVTTGMTPGAPVREAAELTPREREVFGLMRSGLSNKEIASRLAISVNTVKKHLHGAIGKKGLRRRQATAQDLKGPV